MSADKGKRLYTVVYKATNLPAYINDAGNLLNISGLLLQGLETNVLAVAPWAASPLGRLDTVFPTIEEFAELLRRTDDPLVYERDSTGLIKIIHRKQDSQVSGAVQQMVWARDDFRCMFCGKGMREGMFVTVDHFMPLELGGANDPSNLITVCRKENKDKGDQHPEEYCKRKKLDYEGLCMYLDGKCTAGMLNHLNR